MPCEKNNNRLDPKNKIASFNVDAVAPDTLAELSDGVYLFHIMHEM